MELGLHFRLNPRQAATVLSAAGDDPRLRAVLSSLEEDPSLLARMYETDKAWDPIHCTLSPEGPDGDWPARGVIGGARSLQHDADASWVTHLSPAEVAEVAEFLASLSDARFREAYAAMPAVLRNPEFGPEEEQYAVTILDGLREFYTTAQASGDHVIFSVAF